MWLVNIINNKIHLFISIYLYIYIYVLTATINGNKRCCPPRNFFCGISFKRAHEQSITLIPLSITYDKSSGDIDFVAYGDNTIPRNGCPILIVR